MSPLHIVPEQPARKHPLLVGTADTEEMEGWAKASVDVTLDLAARQMAATLLLESARIAVVRLTAVAAGQEMTASFIAAHESAKR